MIPIAAWLALAFLLRAARMLPPFSGLANLALALYVALAVGQSRVHSHRWARILFAIAGITVMIMAPFVADRLLVSRIAGWTSTLIFPTAWVASEFARARLTPGCHLGFDGVHAIWQPAAHAARGVHRNLEHLIPDCMVCFDHEPGMAASILPGIQFARSHSAKRF